MSGIRKVVAIEHVTLDGVMQAPGRADEDERGGFEHGGWGHAGSDEVTGRKMGEGMAELRLVDSVTTTTGVFIGTYETGER
jgi:hypothetical protein